MAPLKSWFEIPKESDFSLANIPFGIVTYASETSPRPAIAIGDYALDLKKFTEHSGFRDLSIIQPHQTVFSEPTLNAFAALGRPIHAVVRKYIQSVFLIDTTYPEVLRDNPAAQKDCLVHRRDTHLHLPLKIGDYTDFYAGMHHAHHCGVILRGASNALQPNYKHLPVGYNGRASSIVVTGTPVRRPTGQILKDPTADIKTPVFSPSRRLDIELELAMFVCGDSALGEPVSVAQAEEHIFGFVLMNDWSARDVQAWEMVPLGPFLAKSFATTVGGWVVLADALEPFKAAGIEGVGQALLPYLQEPKRERVYDIRLQVGLRTAKGNSRTLVETSSRNLLYSFPQMVAHQTVNGCPLRTGDLLASGTISGPDRSAQGSLLEQTEGGKDEIDVGGGETRLFLEDGDHIVLSGRCGSEEGGFVGFGLCEGTILPAHTFNFS